MFNSIIFKALQTNYSKYKLLKAKNYILLKLMLKLINGVENTVLNYHVVKQVVPAAADDNDNGQN